VAADRPPFDVIVVGSGPAGVSAAFPLVEAGLRVLMVDGGEVPGVGVPDAEYLAARASDPRQWEWMVGRDFRALREPAATSPKFRAPTLDYAFRGFAEANRITAEGFIPVGSLAVGGLSNAWGCGVAQFSGSDLEAFPFAEDSLLPSFEAVARRIGVSGRCDDDLSSFFGVDAWAQSPIPMDALHETLARNYRRHRKKLVAGGFRLGRARLAVLSEPGSGERQSCSQQGFCLWGCAREALYSARFELRHLARHPNFEHRSGLVVDRLERDKGSWRVCGRDRRDGGAETIAGRSIVMAAGTLATTSIVMRSLPHFTEARLLALPMAAFALWLPTFFGTARTQAPALAQLAFTLDGAPSGTICGFTFSTHALPVSEFVHHSPLARRHALRLFRALLSSTVVANCFFPGRLSENRIRRAPDGSVHVIGGVTPALSHEVAWARSRLRAAFLRAGAVLLPTTFTPGKAGADAHYAGTIPMRQRPEIGESTPEAEVQGLPGVFVADASAFPALPAKSHTLALMACADRVGRMLSRRLSPDH
jgi:choline dehydrogenase-like flavoprotein